MGRLEKTYGSHFAHPVAGHVVSTNQGLEFRTGLDKVYT